MGLRINTNVPSLSSARILGKTREALTNNLRKMSSGERITRAGDDAAGLAISENLKSQIRSLRQNKRNAQDAISLIQTAEGGLAEVSSLVIRLRELSVQAATDTLSDRERKFSNIEFQNLKEEIDRIAESSEFNGVRLLNGTEGVLDFQIGIHNNPILDRIKLDTAASDSTLTSLGLTTSDITTKLGAQASLKALDDSLVKISGIRASLGAKQNRLASIINNLEVNDENISAANSRIRDVDVASESADLTKNNILLQSGMAVLAQANNFPQHALKLLNQ